MRLGIKPLPIRFTKQAIIGLAMMAGSLWGGAIYASHDLDTASDQKIERWLAYHDLPNTEEARTARDINRMSFRDMGERGFLWGLGISIVGVTGWSLAFDKQQLSAKEKREQARKLIEEAEREELTLLTLESLKEVITSDDSTRSL